MAEGYIKHGETLVQMRGSNTKYYDEDAQAWKSPRQASYYDGSRWIPFIVPVPSPGTQLSGTCNAGKVYYYELPAGLSSTCYFHPLDLIRDSGYDVETTMQSGGNVILRMRRSPDSDTTRNVGFHVHLRNSENLFVAYGSGVVYQNGAFSVTLPKEKVTNGMYLRWTGTDSGLNTGWQFYMEPDYILEF